MQIIFKAITRSSGHASWWGKNCTALYEEGCLMPQPWKVSKVLTAVRKKRKSPTGENFPRQWPAPWLLRQIFLPVIHTELQNLVTGRKILTRCHIHESIYSALKVWSHSKLLSHHLAVLCTAKILKIVVLMNGKVDNLHFSTCVFKSEYLIFDCFKEPLSLHI